MSETESTQIAGDASANLPASTLGVQPNSSDQDQLVATLEAKLLDRLTNNPRLLQSLTDKTISKVESNKSFREFRDQYRAMKEKGMSEAEIDNEVRLAELEARFNPPAHVAPGSATDGRPAELDELLPALGLEVDDVDALRIMAQPITAIAKAAELARLSQRRKNSPNPAAASQGAGTPAPRADAAQLAREYKQKAIAAHGNRTLIRQIQADYRAKGLAVEGVDLTAP